MGSTVKLLVDLEAIFQEPIILGYTLEEFAWRFWIVIVLFHFFFKFLFWVLSGLARVSMRFDPEDFKKFEVNEQG